MVDDAVMHNRGMKCYDRTLQCKEKTGSGMWRNATNLRTRDPAQQYNIVIWKTAEKCEEKLRKPGILERLEPQCSSHNAMTMNQH